MSENGGKKNSTMIALAVVLVVAVILSLVLFNQRNSLSAQLDNLTEELAESRQTWESTAAEKETIEAQLQNAQDALREAETALEESTTKIGALQSELEESQRVREEAQGTLDTLYLQIDSLTETLNYARNVLAGATEEPADDEEVETEAPEADEAEDELPLIAPVLDGAAEVTEEPAEEPEATEEPTEEPEAEEATEEPAEEPEVTEEPTEEPEAEEATEEPAEEPADEPDEIIGIPEDAVELEVVLEDETTVLLYVQVEDGEITFIYSKDIDLAFLEQFVGKTLPVVLLSDEEPEGIAPIEDDEATTQAVIDAINSLIPAEDETVDTIVPEDETAA